MPTRKLAVPAAVAAAALVGFGLGQTAIASAGQARDRPGPRLEVLTAPEIALSGWPGLAIGILLFAVLGAAIARAGGTPVRAALTGGLAMFVAQAASAILQPLVFPTAELLSVPPIGSATWFIYGMAVAAVVLLGTPLAAGISWLSAVTFQAAAARRARSRLPS